MSEIAVDTSAFVALFKGEPRTDALQSVLSTVSLAVVPATCLVELALLRRVDGNLLPWASSLVSNPPYRVVETTLAEAGIAVDAALRFGKGSGHPAKLNFGDCLVYAAAKQRNLPLLFVGDDFHLTDLKPALTRG